MNYIYSPRERNDWREYASDAVFVFIAFPVFVAVFMAIAVMLTPN